MAHMMKETTKIPLNPSDFNKDTGFVLNWTWQPKLNQSKNSSHENWGQVQKYVDSTH
jgi:hypothetical protein